MSWLGLFHGSTGQFDPSGLDQPRKSTDQALLNGTIMMEATFGASRGDVHLVTCPWSRRHVLQVSSTSNGDLNLSVNGNSCTLRLNPAGPIQDLRLSYSWDIVRQRAVFSLEFPGHGRALSIAAPVPEPLLLLNMRRMFLRPTLELSDTVTYFAISDRIEPVGPAPRLPGQTPIQTPIGPAPLETLKRGDCVTTRDGRIVPVLFRVFRSVPAFGRFAPMRLHAPYLGLTSDLVVGGEQRVAISGVEVEYMFGRETVFVSSKTLENKAVARPDTGSDFITYHQLLLPEHEILSANGCGLESLYIGRLRRHQPRHQRSILRRINRQHIPEQAELRFPELHRVDAMALLSQNAA